MVSWQGRVEAEGEGGREEGREGGRRQKVGSGLRFRGAVQLLPQLLT